MNYRRLRKSALLIINLFVLIFTLIFYSFLFTKPVRAQMACDCYFSAPCDPNSGAILLGSSTFTICGGVRLDPTILYSNCEYTPECSSPSGCAPCNLTAAQIGGANLELNAGQSRALCESGAFCGGSATSVRCSGTTAGVNCAGGVWTSEAGLFSSLFKQCYCGLGSLVQVLVNIGYTVIGALSVTMFAIGAWKYIFARNDPEKLIDAKATLTSAMVGFVFVLLSITLLSLIDAQLSPWGINFFRYR